MAFPEKPRGQLPGAQGKQSSDKGAMVPRLPPGHGRKASREGSVENEQKKDIYPTQAHTFIRHLLHTIGEVH